MEKENNSTLTNEIILSLTETKREILRNLSNENIENKLKSKLVQHLIKIDRVLLMEIMREDVYDLIMKKEERN